MAASQFQTDIPEFISYDDALRHQCIFNVLVVHPPVKFISEREQIRPELPELVDWIKILLDALVFINLLRRN